MQELKELEARHPELQQPDSPRNGLATKSSAICGRLSIVCPAAVDREYLQPR